MSRSPEELASADLFAGHSKPSTFAAKGDYQILRCSGRTSKTAVITTSKKQF
jgi:hypothetical protein